MAAEQDVNLGNPSNARRDAEERNDAKVTNADHPRPSGRGADDLFDDTVRPDMRGTTPNPDDQTAPMPTTVMEVAGAMNPGAAVVPPVVPAPPAYDMHSPRVDDPDAEMVGDPTYRHDPLSGESGTHPVGVGVGAAAGGAAVGAATGLVAGAVAGPLGAAIGAAAGTVIGAIAGGYAGKGIAETVNPTTEDHYWRTHFHHRPYVRPGAKYEEYEAAYTHGITMRERLIDMTWEDAEQVVRVSWEESQAGMAMPWEQARPAIQDAWDRLTPEPGEPEVTEEERRRDD
jgi:uncharacterized protein YcfJ